jgi:hypothetical protein
MDGVNRIELDPSVEAEPVQGARTRKRDSMFLSARLRFGDDKTVHDVRVRNLSEGGLMAELNRAIDPGMPVALEMRGLGEMTGSVAWCTRGRIGIALDHPIDPARARKPVGSGSTTPDFAKPLFVSARRR